MAISAPRRPGTPPTVPAWDTQPSRPRFQGLLCTIAALALLPAVAATLMRVFPPADDQTARLAAFIAYGLIGYLIALGCLLIVLVRARHRFAIAVIIIAVALVIIGLPLIYIANGLETSRQVNALFVERKCADVVNYKTFENYFVNRSDNK